VEREYLGFALARTVTAALRVHADLSVEYGFDEDEVAEIHERMTLLVEANAPCLARQQQRRHRRARKERA
jgi:hypothetical protein